MRNLLLLVSSIPIGLSIPRIESVFAIRVIDTLVKNIRYIFLSLADVVTCC